MAKTKSKVELGSAFDLLPKSWEIVKKNWQVFAVVNIFSIISAIFEGLNINAEKTTTSDGVYFTTTSDRSSDFFNGIPPLGLAETLGIVGVLLAVLLAVNIVLFAMMAVLHVRSSAGTSPSLSDLFKAINKNWLWLRLIGLAIASFAIVVAGLILLIVPGIIALGRVVMAGYIMIDKDLSIVDSLKASNEMGKKYPGKIWAAIGVVIVASLLANVLGLFPVVGPLAGALLSIAWSLVLALRYQQLKAIS